MNVAKILEEYKNGKIGKKKVLMYLKDLPFSDLGDIKLDNHRKIRKGFSEVVFCQNKNILQIEKAVAMLEKTKSNFLLTKIDKKKYSHLKKFFKKIAYHEQAEIAYNVVEHKKLKKGILVLCAGTSDIPVAEEAAITASVMGHKVERVYDVGVAGIHRLLHFRKRLQQAHVVIVVAGMEGALASVVAGLTDKPVIAVPTSVGYGASFKGLSALLTMLNCCSPGVTVVNIDNGFGAGYVASMINRMIR